MNTKFIKKGEKVILSETGHNGFFYPTKKEKPILYDVVADLQSWVGSSELTPFTIPENAVIVSGNPNRKIAVWIK